MGAMFAAHLEWSGASKGPTGNPATFSRDFMATLAGGGVTVPVSSASGHEVSRANPEELFVASLAACYGLTYLFLAARQGIVVSAYADDAEGRLEVRDGRTRVSRVTLRPHITLEPGASADGARALVERAHQGCYIANSVSATVEVMPAIDFAHI